MCTHTHTHTHAHAHTHTYTYTYTQAIDHVMDEAGGVCVAQGPCHAKRGGTEAEESSGQGTAHGGVLLPPDRQDPFQFSGGDGEAEAIEGQALPLILPPPGSTAHRASAHPGADANRASGMGWDARVDAQRHTTHHHPDARTDGPSALPRPEGFDDACPSLELSDQQHCQLDLPRPHHPRHHIKDQQRQLPPSRHRQCPLKPFLQHNPPQQNLPRFPQPLQRK